MTQEEHNLLVANNQMLQDIVTYIAYQQANKDNEDLKEFLSNVVADVLVTRRFGK